MKVYLQPDVYSRGVVRVADALMQYAPPSIQLVQDPFDADLEIIHVYGRHDRVERRINLLERKGKPFAMIQYVLRSAIRPSTHDWIEMWQKAKLVWSYYDLPELCREDGMGEQLPNGDYTMPGFNFYYAPLGVDPEVFKQTHYNEKRFIVGACSQHALSEGARECAIAAKNTQNQMFFLGHELRRGADIVCKSRITDQDVANYWSQCRYVSGLRRIEGFELPVIEGALCGARPIVYDRPHYRKWFNEFAIFIKEEPREKVIANLEKIFTGFYGEINENDKALIRERFNWETIITNFWNQVL